MSSRMKPFFSFYGAKWRLAPHYPKPEFGVLVQPFTGSAQYATLYPHLDVRLYDLDPVICGIWDYLIHVTEAELRRLPLTVHHVDDVHAPQAAKDLIGFWLCKAGARPQRTFGKWAGKYPTGGFWGPRAVERLVQQVPHIRHWKVRNESYERASEGEATWCVDPPYQKGGMHYRCNDIDYLHLASWCQSRQGQVIVCEAEGADWLPFRPFRETRAMSQGAGSRGQRVSKEVFWTND